MLLGQHSRSLIGPIIIGLALTFSMPLLLSSYTLGLLAIYAMLALSLGLVWGYGGILCFGQSAYFGLGAYAYAIAAINIGESTLPVIIGVAVPAVFGFLLALMIFYGRLSDVYVGVITLVVALILQKLLNSSAGPEYLIGDARLGGFNGIPGFPTLNVPGSAGTPIYGDAFYYVCAFSLLLVYLFSRSLTASAFGIVAVGIRENELRAELIGYDPRIRKSALFAVGSAIAGLAGVLYANWAEVVTPGLFALGLSAEIIIWCIAGGLGTLAGPMLGAVVLSLIKIQLGQQTSINNTAIMGALLIAIVLFLPAGFLPQLQRLVDVLGTKRTSKNRKRRRQLAQTDG